MNKGIVIDFMIILIFLLTLKVGDIIIANVETLKITAPEYIPLQILNMALYLFVAFIVFTTILLFYASSKNL